MKWRLGAIARNLAGVIAGLLLLALLLEGGVRILAETLGISPYMHYHEMLGWTSRPDVVKHHRSRSGEFDVTYRINALGYRGPDYPQEKSPGQYRILVLGDSVGFGWGVAEQETFAGILDRELADVEVFNLALSGFGMDQSYLRFLHEGMALRPDFVIVQATPNDFEEIQYPFFNQKAKPYFALTTAGELELRNVPVRSIGTRADEFYARSLPLPFREWLGWHSFAYNVLNEYWHSLSRGRQQGKPDVQAVFTPDSVALFNAIIGRLAEKIAATGARGVLVHSSRVASDSALIAGNHLPVIDMYPLFRRTGSGDEAQFYFADGYHWNSAGHRLVADQLKEHIQSLRAAGQVTRLGGGQ